jgi:hypothetical protein
VGLILINNTLFLYKEKQMKLETINNLYKKKYYTAPIDSVVGRICEYDMKEAGFSVIKKRKLLSENKIKLLQSVPKSRRTIEIGKLQINNQLLREKMPMFIEYERFMFMIKNGVRDNDILMIKNDAILVVGIRCKSLENNGVKFVEKNIYTSYHQLGGIKFLYNGRKESLDIDGISDELLYLHEEGMISFFIEAFRLIELNNLKRLSSYLLEFANNYKAKKLPLVYYREFNATSNYLIRKGDMLIGFKDVDESMLDDIEIGHNYVRYILPLINKYLLI